MKSGIAIHRATASFTVAGKQYPANSLVVKSAQAFRPHMMDMFEPQDHPDDIPYPGAPPIAPYDVAGYTLAYQMGVQFDRILDGFDGPFEKLTDFAKPPAGSIRGAQTAAGYYFSHKSNDSFIAINRLLNANEDVTWLWNGPMGYGTFYVAAQADDARPAREGGDGSRCELRSGRDGADRTVREAPQAAHRALRYLRRRHARRAGRGCCSRTSSSRSRSSIRRCSTPATCARSTTC